MLTYVALLIGLFAVMFAVFYIAERQIFAPWSVTLGVWVIVLCAYLGVHEELYAVSDNFLKCLVLWVTLFSISSYLAYKGTPAYKSPQWEPCEKNINIITILTIVIVPFAVYRAVQHAAMLGDPAGLFISLREQAIDPEQNKLGVAKYFVYVVNVLLMIEVTRKTIRKKRLAIIIVMCLLFLLATMAKQTLFMYLFTSLYLLHDDKRISMKPIIIIALVMIATVPLMAMLKSGSDGQDADAEFVGSLLMTYSVASIVAFDYITPCSSVWWGEETFRPFYNILHGLGFNVPTTDVIQDFIYVPMVTNVYTIMSPFYKDFGVEGVCFFAVFEGVLFGIIFKYAKTGNNIVRYIYAYLFSQLVMQFFDEEFFKAISSIIQVTLLLLICHTNFRLTRHLKKEVAQ